MVEYLAVKDIFRLPVLFLFIFVLLFLCLFALGVLNLWGSNYSEGNEAALRLVEARLLHILIEILPSSVLLTLIFVLLRTAIKPGSRLLSLVIPLAGAFLLLAFGYQVLEGFQKGLDPEPQPSAYRFLAPHFFNRKESKVLYLDALEEQTMSSVMIVEGQSSEQRLLYYPQGRVSTEADKVILRMPGYTLETGSEPVYAGMFEETPVLHSLYSDLTFLNGELQNMYEASLVAFYFTVIALVIAFYGSGLLFRLTRWPLLNLALCLLAMRGLLALIRFMRVGIAMELGKALSNPQALQVLPELVLLILGAVLLFIDLLFIPFDRWKGE